mgnify:CR=1 FL=1
MITLSEPTLGELELRGSPFLVSSFQIGSRAPRGVMRSRALADGMIDDTRYAGSRAVTLAVTVNERDCGPAADRTTIQGLLDRLLPYMQPRRRCTLTWSLPGSDVRRQLTVRGDSAPVQIENPRHPRLVLQFIAPDGEITTPGVHTLRIDPASDVESGRVYSTGTELKFDRNYPVLGATGSKTVTQQGNEPAHWRLTIFGGAVNPFFTINGVTIDMSSNGGHTVAAGSSLVIDTRNRYIWADDSPLTPKYDRSNFTEWAWSDLLLQPGDNTVRFGADTLTGGQAQLEWSDTWAG